MFGLPNARTNRWIHGNPSETAVPAGVVTAKATASGPSRSATARMRSAVHASASSQPIRVQPASGSLRGRVRRMG
jgi:hypothetical protein